MEKMKFSDLNEEDKNIINLAIMQREKAYAPYSKFKVGAALRDSNGMVFTGCNIESADYTLTSHAEMVAIDSMVKSGSLKMAAIAITMNSGEKICVPCGLCRQKISEFSDLNAVIYGVNLDVNNKPTVVYKTTLDELMPYSFKANYFM